MKFFITVFIPFIPIIIQAQDPLFSQFYSSPLQLNPSLAGSMGAARFVSAYRNQWPGLSGNFTTYHDSYDQHLPFIKGGLGVNIINDIAGEGTLKTDRVGIIYAPLLYSNNKVSLKTSLAVDFFQKTLKTDKLTFGDMIDPRYGFINTTNEVLPSTIKKNGIDFSSGLLINGRKWNAGIALFHLTKPDEGLMGISRLPRKLTIHGSYSFYRSDSAKFAFTPMLICSWQGFSTSYLPGLNFKYRKFHWGFAYRWQDAVITMAGFKGKYFRIAYSYDVTVSQLGNTGGSHEVNIAILLNHKKIPEGFLRIEELAY